MDQCTVNNLSLCSGGGGLDLGLELALGVSRTVCWVEWEAFAAEFLASRMEAGCLAQAPIWTDLRTFDGKPWRGVVDSITAGYPCQPFSMAGKRLGEADPRHLWPEVHRVIGEVKPGIVFLENVPGHLTLGYETVEADLQGLGYTVTPGLFSAREVGCSQLRKRLFILAVGSTKSARLERTAWKKLHRAEKPAETSLKVGIFPPPPEGDWSGIPQHLWPATQSGLCELVDGLAPNRTNYLKLLGNGVVPLQAAYAFLSLFALSQDKE